MSADTHKDNPSARRGRRGRAVVIGGYILLATYITGAFVLSVVRDLYGKPPPPQEAISAGNDRPQALWCIRRLTALKEELVEHSAQMVRPGSLRKNQLERWKAWDAQWQRRFSLAEQRCDDMAFLGKHDPVSALAEIHEAFKQGIEGILAAQTDLLPRLEYDLLALVRKHNL